MTKLAAILLLLASLQLVKADVLTLQTSPDLIHWTDAALVTNQGEPVCVLRLVNGIYRSWTAVSNAVAYTVWMPDQGKFLVTTSTFAYLQPGRYFLTARDAQGNDSNPSDIYQL